MKGLIPSIGITAYYSVLKNTRSGAIFLATPATELTQCQGENRNHIVLLGDMTLPAPNPVALLDKLVEELTTIDLYLSDNQKEILRDKVKWFITKNCL